MGILSKNSLNLIFIRKNLCYLKSHVKLELELKGKFMKSIRCFSLLIMTSILMSFSPNSLNYSLPTETKTYISADKIHFIDNQIYLYINEEFVPVSRINCDEGGIFIENSTYGGPVLTWECPKCGTKNFRYPCANCGYPQK